MITYTYKLVKWQKHSPLYMCNIYIMLVNKLRKAKT